MPRGHARSTRTPRTETGSPRCDVRYLESLAADTADAVSFLKALAEEGPALELGIGTGRVAIPLTEAGVDVHGVETSDAMVSKLRAKPGGDGIDITIGSFADFSSRDPLPACIRRVQHLLLTADPGRAGLELRSRRSALDLEGAFSVQAGVPDVTRFEGQHQRVAVESVGIDEFALEMSSHDAVAQRTDSQYVLLRKGHSALPVRMRYAYVSELDRWRVWPA